MTILCDALLTTSSHGRGWSLVWRRDDSLWFGILRAVLDKGPLRVAHLSMLRSLDRSRPRINQLVSSELQSMRIGMCCHQSIQSDTVPFHTQVVECYVPPSDHPCLTAVHKDGSGPSYAPPTTVSPPQLWSCGVVQATNYEKTISSSSYRWKVFGIQILFPIL